MPNLSKDRLLTRPGRGEFAALTACIVFMLALIVMNSEGKGYGADYRDYLAAARGEHGFYYAYWIMPVFEVLARLPFALGFALWSLVNLLGFAAAVRLGGGKPTLSLLSYQALSALWYGQIIGLLVFAVLATWHALNHRHGWLAGLTLTLALTKPQFGLPLGIAVLLLARCTWLERLKALLVVLTITAASLIVYPLWPLRMLHDIQALDYVQAQAIPLGNIGLWPALGVWSLLLWLAVLLPMDARRKVMLIGCCSALALPYYQASGLLGVYALDTTGMLALLGNVSWSAGFTGWAGVALAVVVPLGAYLWIVGQALWQAVVIRLLHDRQRVPALS